MKSCAIAKKYTNRIIYTTW